MEYISSTGATSLSLRMYSKKKKNTHTYGGGGGSLRTLNVLRYALYIKESRLYELKLKVVHSESFA